MKNYSVLSVPTPFPVGPTNVYLFHAEPITLIDCGPYSVEAKVALQKQLNGLGLSLERVQRILITHAHPDHFGLAAELQRISGAPIYMHNKEVIKAQDRYQHLQRIASYLAYAGMPSEMVGRILEYFKWETQFVQAPEKIIGVGEEHTFSFDEFELEGFVTPGHAAGHMCFFQKEKGLLFAGDTILGEITPNPVLEPVPEQPLLREKSLQQYINSLKRLRELRISRILPGHGEPVLHVKEEFQRMNRHHLKRKQNTCKILGSYKEFTPFHLTVELYQMLKRPVDFYLAMSETLGYLDILEAEGKVKVLPKTSGLVYAWQTEACLDAEAIETVGT